MGGLFKENFGLVMFFQLPYLPLSLLMDAFDLISIIDVHLIHEQVDHNSYNVFKLFFFFGNCFESIFNQQRFGLQHVRDSFLVSSNDELYILKTSQI